MKKYLIRAAIAFSTILLIAVSTLAIHLYMVSSKVPQHHQNWQLSRIDFDDPISDIEAQKVTAALKSIDGINQVVINKEQGTVVYGYQTNSLNSNDVFTAFMNKGDFKAQAHKAKSLANVSGCPVIDKSSISYRIGSIIKPLIPSNN